MCGLVGVAGELALKDEELIKRLLYFDHFRGQDSTGLAAIRSDGTAHIAKLSSVALDLFEQPRFKKALNGHMSTVFLGHNRAATRGVVNNNNAHPFQFDHIVGAHNGTLDYSATKRLEDALDDTYAVDSQAIFASIARFGLKDTIEMMTGAWALTYVDTDEGTLNFIRNGERPLWFAYNKECDRIFWASEYWMIDAAFSSLKRYDELYIDKKGNGFFYLPEDTHYKFDLEALRKGAKTPPKPVAKTLEGRKETKTAVHPFTRPATTKTGGAGQTKRIDTVPFVGNQTDLFAGLIDRDRAQSLHKSGCSWCKEKMEVGTMGITVYDDRDIILCPSCSNGPSDAIRVYTKNIDALV